MGIGEYFLSVITASVITALVGLLIGDDKAAFGRIAGTVSALFLLCVIISPLSGVIARAKDELELIARRTIVELEGDVDAFCFNRELAKEDGSMPVAGETLAFKVVELRKAAKKATLSHAKTYAAAVEARVAAATAEADNTKRAVKKINSSVEKTTLGDIDALAALKDQLEGK